MSQRTNGQLAADFPVDTLAHFKASSSKFDQLVRDQQLKTDEAKQVLAYFGTQYLDALAETAAIVAPGLAKTGAGAVTRHYVCVPSYPIADPSLFQPTVKMLPGPPPFGRPNPNQELAQVSDARTRRYVGGAAATAAIVAAITDIAATQAALDATHYVTITTPNPGGLNVPNELYDVLVVVTGAPNLYYLVAANVPANTAVVDNGVGVGPFSLDKGAGIAPYMAPYSIYAHTEIGWDPAGPGSVVCSPVTPFVGE